MSREAGMLLGLGSIAGAYYLTRSIVRSETARIRTELEVHAPPEPASGPPVEIPARFLAIGPKTEPRPKRPTKAVSRRFDSMFAEHGRGLPVAYLRALAKRESNMDPFDTVDPAWGLLQVIEVVRLDYNRRHGTTHSRRDLLDPVTNITIVAEALRRIIDSYRRNHPTVPNLQEDFDNPRFVELLTFGWNAGYSERAGVGRVAKYLEARGITDLTIDTVHASAVAAKASRHLRRADKVAWCKSVRALFQRELARDRHDARHSVS
jgi:hypothetical protein